MSSRGHPNRRQFVGLLGGGAAASIGAAGTADAHERDVVSMGNHYFDPVGLYVEPGATVRFEIDAGSHSATAYKERIPADASPFDSGTISAGGFEYTFETPGTYDYYCLPHESMGMVGRVVVGRPGGPAEASPIPHGDVPASEAIVEQEIIPIDEFDDAGGGSTTGMMGSGSSMMAGSGPGLMMFIPVGVLTVLLGLMAGVAYWASQVARSDHPSGEVATTSRRERSAGSDIDDDGFQRPRKRSSDGERTTK